MKDNGFIHSTIVQLNHWTSLNFTSFTKELIWILKQLTEVIWDLVASGWILVPHGKQWVVLFCFLFYIRQFLTQTCVLKEKQRNIRIQISSENYLESCIFPSYANSLNILPLWHLCPGALSITSAKCQLSLLLFRAPRAMCCNTVSSPQELCV